MIPALRDAVFRWLRVPPEPEPPPGDAETLRVFRAAPSYFRYKLLGWGLGQIGTLAGLVAGLVLIGFLGDRFGGWIDIALTAAEVLAWLGFLSQLPVSLAALRLDYELRWYMLSDRALRIREGILKTREQTMTFANIQQISIRQGPIQRLLGIADVEVRTAGGGGGSSDEQSGDDMHRGFFRGVADGESIRDTIRDRVRRYRDAGLGDEPSHEGRTTGAPGAIEPWPALDAARDLLGEVRALRQTVAPGR